MLRFKSLSLNELEGKNNMMKNKGKFTFNACLNFFMASAIGNHCTINPLYGTSSQAQDRMSHKIGLWYKDGMSKLVYGTRTGCPTKLGYKWYKYRIGLWYEDGMSPKISLWNKIRMSDKIGLWYSKSTKVKN